MTMRKQCMQCMQCMQCTDIHLTHVHPEQASLQMYEHSMSPESKGSLLTCQPSHGSLTAQDPQPTGMMQRHWRENTIWQQHDYTTKCNDHNPKAVCCAGLSIFKVQALQRQFQWTSCGLSSREQMHVNLASPVSEIGVWQGSNLFGFFALQD